MSISVDSFEVFLTTNPLRINAARMEHLASLKLAIAGKRVLEVGAGIGLLTGFFEELGCSVLTTDGRSDNVAEIRRKYPHRQAEVLDLDTSTDITHLGEFDIIFCYGTLYHLANPEQAIKALAAVCQEMILLETCVTPGDDFAVNLVSENQDNPNQASSGMGCRPTRLWVMEMLRKYLGFAYVSQSQPFHYDFDLDWQSPLPKKLHRSVFVGSKSPLTNDQLLNDAPIQQVYSLASDQTSVEEMLVLREELVESSRITHVFEALSTRGLLALAELLAVHHSVNYRYPKWYSNAAWTRADIYARCRQMICDHLKAKKLEHSIKFNWCNDLQLYLDLSASLDSDLYIFGSYEPNTFHFFSRVLESGMTFLDLGADKGFYSLFASWYVGSNGLVLSFEPNFEYVQSIKANILLNQIANIKFLAEQQVKVEEIENPTTDDQEKCLNLLDSELDEILVSLEQHSVNIVRINLPVNQVGIIKIVEILLHQSRPLFQLELHDNLGSEQATDSKVLHLLRASGYELFAISEFTGLPIKMENFSLVSSTVIAAHPERSWEGLTESEQMRNKEEELERLYGVVRKNEVNFEQLQVQLQTQLGQTESELSRYTITCEQLQSELAHTKIELENTSTSLRQHQDLARDLKETIAAMEDTKFWKLREVWLGLKSVFGLKKND